MSADERPEVDRLFELGDPARRLSPMLAQRVARRLDESAAHPPRGRLPRLAVVGVVLVSSIAAGAVLTREMIRRSMPVVKPALAVAPIAEKHGGAAPADSTAQQAALLQAGLEALQLGQADVALARLDELRLKFPQGLLRVEADVARVRALLLARRDEEALAELARFEDADLTGALRLTWADTLARHHRCSEATGVLSAAVNLSVAEQEIARAIHARCAP